ncbi:MAG: hypothetical protein ABJK39_10870 [Hyphomicrobiales bacterium]
MLTSDNATQIEDVRVFEKIGLDLNANKKVKPHEFTEWAASLKIDFPNLVSKNERSTGFLKSDELNPKERESLLKLVIGMALEQYGYDPNAARNEVTSNIATDLETNGVPLDKDTILKWLREGADHLRALAIKRKKLGLTRQLFSDLRS